jgi:superfamily II DNA or RNA helicase
LVRQFAEQGYNFVSISYKEDDEYKRLMIEEFSNPDTTIHGLIATDILTRGFDVPDVMIGISARPFSKSLSSHVQQMGRVMRPCEGKEFGLWLDHSGNYLRFRDDWENVYALGVSELSSEGEKAKKEPTEKQKKDATCPQCKALLVGPTCPCGYVRPIRNTVLSVPGEMVELGSKQTNDVNRNFYSELMTFARQKGYKTGWAAHKFKERFGIFPPHHWNGDKPRAVSSSTAGWVRSRMIAYAKTKAKSA